MLEFDPNNPFPLIAELSPEHYAAAKRHASAADKWLHLAIDSVETSLRDPKDGQERWIDRNPSVFLTPYVELRAWLEQLKLKPGEKVVDLGAGYGRLGFVMHRHFPGNFFHGFELVNERVREGQNALMKFGATNAMLETANIAALDWKPPRAEVYFIYDYGSREAVSKTLGDLRELSKNSKFRVVGRGRGVRDQIEHEHPWLGLVHSPTHFAHYSIYRTFE